MQYINIYIVNTDLNIKLLYSIAKAVDLNCALQSCSLNAGICRNLHILKTNKFVIYHSHFNRNIQKTMGRTEKKKYIYIHKSNSIKSVCF